MTGQDECQESGPGQELTDPEQLRHWGPEQELTPWRHSLLSSATRSSLITILLLQPVFFLRSASRPGPSWAGTWQEETRVRRGGQRRVRLTPSEGAGFDDPETHGGDQRPMLGPCGAHQHRSATR